jgi:hypothetical protein
MPTKSRSTKQLSADDLFNRALPAFTKELRNLFDDRERQLRTKIAKIKMTDAQLVDKTVNPIQPRYALYEEDATKIGEDFLSAFNRIVRPFCSLISDSSKKVLINLLSEQYKAVINQTERGLQWLLISLGRQEQFQEIFRPARRIYRYSSPIYFNRLDAEIEKHNLEVTAKAHNLLRQTEEPPVTLDSNTPTMKKRKRRNRRTIAQLEVLIPKIVAAYEERYDTGRFTVSEVFQDLAKRSHRLFHQKLTAGQIRGIYNRREKFL